MKKFTNNDIFYNTLLASPKYTVVFHSGSLRINDQINQNLEKSSSISGEEYAGTLFYRNYTASSGYTASITREYIHKVIGQYEFNEGYTDYSTVNKVATLNNIFHNYHLENQYANMDYYLKKNLTKGDYSPINVRDSKWTSYSPSNPATEGYFIQPTCSINLIQIPREFYGNYIKPGSVKLNMYISGNLVASAEDTDKTGKIYQTFGSGSNGIIGSIFYDDGIMLLTGSTNLSTQTANYIQPLPELTGSNNSISDYLKWIHFGSYSQTTGSGINTKYELIFQGTNFIPTLTMMCHAEKEELFWSNNRTFLEADQGTEIFAGQTSSVGTYTATSGSALVPSSKVFQENKIVMIKNTISSSFVNYSESYQPQVFISQVGIYDEDKNLIAVAKLANPIRKTKEMEYTIKLKLDL